MTLVIKADVMQGRFRLPGHYEFIPFERLELAERETLRDVRAEPDFCGVLKPRDGSGRAIKAVGHDVAQLYSTLGTHGPLPAALERKLGVESAEAIARLVLDDVLEIEWEGAFVSGAAAYWAIFDREPPSLADGRLARLSIEALEWAQSLGLADAHAISERLYRYNTQPASPMWRRRFSATQAVAAFLEIDRFGATADLAEFGGGEPQRHESQSVWWSWRLGHSPDIVAGDPVFKLYVSPTIDGVRDALRVVIALVGTNGGAVSLKVGRSVYGLLRPDKLVIYFRWYDDLAQTGERLHQELAGMPAQGVPFSAELAGDGLLSWGADPPASEQLPAWRGPESWRFWVTNRLATSLLAAQGDRASAIQPWQFATQRIALDGVDPRTWTPCSTEWVGVTARRDSR